MWQLIHSTLWAKRRGGTVQLTERALQALAHATSSAPCEIGHRSGETLMSGSRNFDRTSSDTESGTIPVRVAPPGRSAL